MSAAEERKSCKTRSPELSEERDVKKARTDPSTPVSALDSPQDELPRAPQLVAIDKELCDHTVRMLRGASTTFSRVDKEDEPPLRVLELGLFGEAVVVPEDEEPPYPYMIERPGRRFFHGYRFDQNVCDEQVHCTEELQRIFGVYDPRADCFFRKTIGYQSKTGEFDCIDKGVLARGLQQALLPAALRVFGEEMNPDAARLSHIYSLYSNLCFPGHIINLHLDVPEFAGVDRSTCPNWLLVCAHCSGLFADKRVRNVTCVFYPRTAPGGALAAYPAITRSEGANTPGEAAVYKAAEGWAVALDADSCFHHSEQSRKRSDDDAYSAAAKAGQGVTAFTPTPIPTLPDGGLGLECVSSTGADPASAAAECDGGEIFWVVKDRDGTELERHAERDCRFSVSCKFHVFSSDEEAQSYAESKKNGGGASALTGSKIIAALVGDLQRKGKLPDGMSAETTPLYELAPIFVNEYVKPTAPRADTMQALWTAHHTTV